MVEIKGPARRNAFLVVIASVLLVTVPLLLTGSHIAEDARTESVSKVVVARWAAGTDYEVQRVNANENELTIVIIGQSTQPSFADLVTGLQTALRRPVTAILKTVPAEKMVSP
jgi:hypothetical protein